MSTQHLKAIDPRMKQALDELEGMVRDRCPDASFEVERGEDNPEGIHLVTTVDVDDPDEVLDIVIDRVLHFQIEEGLPVHVIPVRPMLRIMEELQQPRRRSRPRMDWSAVLPPA